MPADAATWCPAARRHRQDGEVQPNLAGLAAARRLKTIVVCIGNHGYWLLKDLCVDFTGGRLDTTRFVGLDFDDPALDLEAIMRGFVAVTTRPTTVDDVAEVIVAGRVRPGPTILFLERQP